LVRRHVPLPPRHASWLRRLLYALAAVSERGWGILLVGGLASIGRGWSYFGPTSPDRTPSQLVFLERLVPLPVYGMLWLAVGFACIAVVVAGQFERYWHRAAAWMPYTVGAVVFMNAIWALSFTIAQFQGVERSYVSALSYGSIAFLMYLVGKMTSVDEGVGP
jgi:hypothetical protein